MGISRWIRIGFRVRISTRNRGIQVRVKIGVRFRVMAIWGSGRIGAVVRIGVNWVKFKIGVKGNLGY